MILALSFAPLRRIFSFRKSKKVNENDNPAPPVEPRSTVIPIADACTMLPESHPPIRTGPHEERSNLPLEARIIRPPRSRFAADTSESKILPSLPQEIGNRRQGRRWGSPLLHPQLLSPLSGAEWLHPNAVTGPSPQTRSIDMATLPEITVDDPEETSVEALSNHLKGPSAVDNRYGSFTSDAIIPSPTETNQEMLRNALRLHFGSSHTRRFGLGRRESTLDDTAVHPGSEDVSESDASLAYQPNLTSACFVGALSRNSTSTDGSDSEESAEVKAAVQRFKYTGPYVHAPPTAPIAIPAPPGLNIHPPPGLPPPAPGLLFREAVFPPTDVPSPVSTPSPPRKVIFLERDSAAARRRDILIGKGASAEVFRVASANGMYRVIKVVDLKKVDAVSLEALKTELTVLTIIKRDQMDVMHCVEKAIPGLEFVMQIPLDVSHYIAIKGRAQQLLMFSEYYPENLDMFAGVIEKGTPAALMKNVLYFIISEITQGLAYLHRQHVVHMDLKLENVFLTAARHCAIGDFGGAVHAVGRVRAAQPGVPSRFQTYTTHGFRAPEVTAASFDPNVRFNCKADFWSLGVCVYKLLVPDGVRVEAMEGVTMRDVGNDYMRMGLVPWVMREKLAGAGCPEEIVELVLNMTQLDPMWRIGEIGIKQHLKKRNRYYKIHHPSPLQLLTPQANPIRASRFEMKPTATGDDPELYMEPERVAHSLIQNMREICAQELVTFY
ncbi:kinase-like domain-containing protein [Pholiota molesta]|nr:kinase-like domain-containing protein [Pholiota molesta]